MKHLSLSLVLFSVILSGCQTMTPEQQAAIPYRSFTPCKTIPDHPKCTGQGQSAKEIEQRKAYASDVLAQEARAKASETRYSGR